MYTTRKAISRPRNKAFTLIEVVIFIAISSIILITIVSLSISVIRQTTTSHHKLYAARYADELAEWLRIQKEISWQDFYNYSQNPIGRTFCVNETIGLESDLNLLDYFSTPDECAYTGVGNMAVDPGPKIFKRTITFAIQPDNKKSVKGTILVEWQEANDTPYFVQVETLFAPR